VDGFDSNAGPYEPKCADGTPCTDHTDCAGIELGVCAHSVGAGVGVNSSANISAPMVCWGQLWVSDGVLGGDPNDVSFGNFIGGQDIHVLGDISNPGEVFGDAYVGGDITNLSIGLCSDNQTTCSTDVDCGANTPCTGTAFVSSGSTLTNVARAATSATLTTVPVDPELRQACDCDNVIDIPTIVADHAIAANNNNSDLGLDEDVYVGADGRIDLQCGHYYLSGISDGGSVAISATGHTALYVGSDIDLGKDLTISLTPESTLDIFVDGRICVSDMRLGNPNYPAQVRMYVSGRDDGSPCAGDAGDALPTDNPSKTVITMTQPTEISGNLYVPSGQLDSSNPMTVYGGIVAGTYGPVNGPTDIHFDTSILNAGQECPSDCGNGVLDGVEQCDTTDLNGFICATVPGGFHGGTLACDSDCTLDTSGCFACGNNNRQGTEECDGTDDGGLDCTNFGFDGGNLVCSGTCTFNTSGCYSCGDGVIDTGAGEACDGANLGSATCLSLGFDGGTLACDADCGGLDTDGCFSCGDGDIDSGELCDPGPALNTNGQSCTTLGFSDGTLGCKADCTFDVSACTQCGDGVLEAPENCDGLSFGGQTCCRECGNGDLEPGEDCDPTIPGGIDCDALGFPGGTLACDTLNCVYDTSGCASPGVCGNGLLEPGEACETLAGTCSISGAACNDNAGCPVGETCDGTEIYLGSGLCASGGVLRCVNCQEDTSACYDCGDGAIDRTCSGDERETCTLDSECAAKNAGLCVGREQCDGSDLGTPPAECGDAGGGFTGGTLGCLSTCFWDTSLCFGCGNGTVEPGEVCDPGPPENLNGETCTSLPAGHDGGILACDLDCLGFDEDGCYFCGDGNVDKFCTGDPTFACTVDGDCAGVGGTCTLGEQCDTTGDTCANVLGGGSTGTATCTAGCAFDTSACVTCGDNNAEGSEVCDGTDLKGEDCKTLTGDSGATGGPPVCVSCSSFDTSSCDWCGDGVQNGTDDCEGVCSVAGTACTADSDCPVSETCTLSFDAAADACDDFLGPNGHGTVSCFPNCAADSSACFLCGDDVLDPGENCDTNQLGGQSCTDFGSFDDGVLACDVSCNVDTTGCYECGDGTINTNEDCEPSGNCSITTATVCANDSECPPAETCDNLGGFTCADFGFSGEGSIGLQCDAGCGWNFGDCTGSANCGNGVVDASPIAEECDDPGGNSDSAPNTCRTDCTDFRCGDNVTDSANAEVCDGTDLNGETCASQGAGSGPDLACLSDCSGYDTSGCGECTVGCPSTCTGGAACIGGSCTSCVTNGDCCAPAQCISGICLNL
jgi:hypothetical protein